MHGLLHYCSIVPAAVHEHGSGVYTLHYAVRLVVPQHTGRWCKTLTLPRRHLHILLSMTHPGRQRRRQTELHQTSVPLLLVESQHCSPSAPWCRQSPNPQGWFGDAPVRAGRPVDQQVSHVSSPRVNSTFPMARTSSSPLNTTRPPLSTSLATSTTQLGGRPR